MLSIQFCVQHDGFLLELTSDKQEAVLDFYLPEEICWWIGLSDVAQEGKNLNHNYCQYQVLSVYCLFRNLQMVCESRCCQLHQLGPGLSVRGWGHGRAEWRDGGELRLQDSLLPARLVRPQLRGHGGRHHALLRSVPVWTPSAALPCTHTYYTSHNKCRHVY